MCVENQWCLKNCDRNCLRRIIGRRRRDRVLCDFLRHRLQLHALLLTLLHRQLRWFEHAARRPVGEIIYGVIG